MDMENPKQRTPEEIAKMEKSRTVSDEEPSKEEMESEKERTEKDEADNKEIEDYIEAHKDQIKSAAEEWIREKELQIKEKSKGFLDKFVGIGAVSGAGTAIVMELLDMVYSNPEIVSFEGKSDKDVVIELIVRAIVNSPIGKFMVLSIAGAMGAAIGGSIGKLLDYLKKRRESKS